LRSSHFTNSRFVIVSQPFFFIVFYGIAAFKRHRGANKAVTPKEQGNFTNGNILLPDFVGHIAIQGAQLFHQTIGYCGKHFGHVGVQAFLKGGEPSFQPKVYRTIRKMSLRAAV
jgi:hypothetical protein